MRTHVIIREITYCCEIDKIQNCVVKPQCVKKIVETLCLTNALPPFLFNGALQLWEKIIIEQGWLSIKGTQQWNTKIVGHM